MNGRRAVRLLVIVASLAAVALVTIWESRERLSPGPLHPSHADVAGLAGNAGCAACHGRRGVSMAAACGACHVESIAQIADGRGLHGAIGAEANDCARCHVEHVDGAIALVSDQAFARSGVGDPGRYDHGHLVGFPLAGTHATLTCTQCHPHADTLALAPGERRFLGLEARCTVCHADPHDEAYGPDCASCHGQDDAFDRVAAFRHDAAFPLEGAHRQACAACHEAESPFAVAAVRLAPGAPRRGCRACHDSPHAPAFARAPGAPDECGACHDAARSSFTGAAARMSAEAHARTGVPLVAPHADLNCAACHAPERPFVDRYPGRTAEDCRACHDDPHGGQFEAGRVEAGRVEAGQVEAGRGQVSCKACHVGARFVPSTFDLVRHGATAFPLVDAHAALDCTACHERGAAGHREFVGIDTACRSCHDDPHAGQFDAAPEHVACASCHDMVRFTPSRFDRDRHAEIAFPLEDAHGEVACAECHERDATGVRRFAGLSTECASCHGDPHAGQFDAGTTTGRCLECHDLARFVPSGFDLARHAGTAFPLEHAHAEVACADCHEPDAAGVRRFAGVASACVSCHDDPHAGQFDGGSSRPAGERCLDCHGTAHFVPSTFDLEQHARTGFALEGGHAAVGCDRCHPRVARAAGDPDRAFRRFVPTERACSACHDDVHGGLFEGAGRPAMSDGRTGCARCHAADAPSFAGVRFRRGEHERWTDFPLEGAHADLDCRACHRRGVDPDPRRHAFGRADRACASCHADPHDRQFERAGGTDCSRCHASTVFDIPRFEHDRTRFPLDDTHAPVTCSACHRASPDGVVRYRPLGTRCQDCHGFAPGEGP